MNTIAQYELGYLTYSEFLSEFPLSISESQECLFGSKCIQFYVGVVLGMNDSRYYVQSYGGDCYEIDERYCIEDTSVEDGENPFIAFLA